MFIFVDIFLVFILNFAEKSGPDLTVKRFVPCRMQRFKEETI